MSTAKEKISKILNEQPDDSSYEEIIRELVLGSIINRGLKDSNEDRVISNDKLKYTLSELLKQCDLKAAMPNEFRVWDESKPAGNEIL